MPKDTITEGSVVRSVTDSLKGDASKEAVLLDMQKNQFYGMNRVGVRIWELLETPLTVKELCTRLQSEFDVAPDECLSDVIGFLNSLLDDGLIAKDV